MDENYNNTIADSEKEKTKIKNDNKPRLEELDGRNWENTRSCHWTGIVLPTSSRICVEQ